MKQKKPLDWFPMWVDKWLFGSTRLELEPDERSVWVDLIALSYKDKGHIRANEGVPYLNTQLAGLLNIPLELLERTIKKCLSIKINKLKLEPDGSLYVVNFANYDFSERHKRRLMSEDADIVSDTADTLSYNISLISSPPIIFNLKSEVIDYIITRWNEFATQFNLTTIKSIKNGSKREKSLFARIKEEGFDFEDLLIKISQQGYLLGDSKDGWTATFDWIFLPNNYQKVVEGNYLKRKGKFDGIESWASDPKMGN